MRIRVRVLRALLGVTLVAPLGGCFLLPEAASVDDIVDDLKSLPGVTAVETYGSPESISVTIARDADDDTVLATAAAAHDIAEAGDWDGDVVFARERGEPGADPDPDLPPSSPWRQTVFPGDPTEVAALLTEVLAIEKLPDVVGIAIIDGWRHVQLASIETFAESFRTLAALPSFADGASYSYRGEAPELKIVHIPERMTVEAIEAVIRIAVENPESEIELASMTTGPRWPELYVARLTAEQAAIVDAQLRDPALADADPEGYSIPFQLAVLGPGGRELTFGTFGDVPDTSS